MTKRAAIGQDDMELVLKACKRAGYERVRIHIDVAAQTIDIMLGEEQPQRSQRTTLGATSFSTLPLGGQECRNCLVHRPQKRSRLLGAVRGALLAADAAGNKASRCCNSVASTQRYGVKSYDFR